MMGLERGGLGWAGAAVVAAAVWGVAGGAARAAGPAGDGEEAAPGEHRTRVVAPPAAPGVTVLRGGRLAAEPVGDLAGALEGLPGVAVVRQGPGAADPVVRGLGQERLDTRVGVVSLQGACPSRMDPPAVYVGLHAVERATLARAGQGAALGGGGLGGRLAVSPDYERPVGAPDEVRGFVGGALDGARRGLRTEAGVMGGLPWLDLRLSGGFERMGDYTAADGTRVPATVNGGGLALSAGVRPAPGQRIWQAFSWSTRADEAFPALPMDLVSAESTLYHAGYRLEGDGALEALRVELGYAYVSHRMDNAHKPNRATLEASTPSHSGSLAAVAEADLRLGSAGRLTVGLDAQSLGRDALRTRRVVASGASFEDHLWPDVSSFEGGLRADLALPVADGWALGVGLRGAWAASDAAAADDGSLGGKTIREQYVAHYGEAAGEVDRDDLLGGAHVNVDGKLTDGVDLRVGLGVGMRAPSVSERYFAFAAAPGGFLVGNPALGSEMKWEAEVALRLALDAVEGTASVFGFHVEDFILQTALARRDVDGDGKEDVIKGFEAVGADFIGAELGATVKLGAHVSLPLGVSWVAGANATEDKDLPLIPPLFGHAAIRVGGEAPIAWWAQVGTRFAAEQDAVDPDYPEDASPAWATLDARAGVALASGLRLEVGVTNLLDATWHDHLTREALLAVGGLAAGDEVPAPGRSFFASARTEF